MNIKLEYRWWLWILIILLIYITVKSPSTTMYLFSGVVHAFDAVGNALLRIIGHQHSVSH